MTSSYEPGRGVHFALSPDQEALLVDEPLIDEELREIIEEIEERQETEWQLPTDKAWDAIHRCLTDGMLRPGTTALHQCVIGSDNLGYQSDGYIISYLTPEDVVKVADAISVIEKDAMRQRYFALDVTDYALAISEDRFLSYWNSFKMLQTFYQRAATAGRATLFTASW